MRIRRKSAATRPAETKWARPGRTGLATATAAIALLAASCGAADETTEASSGDGSGAETAAPTGPRLDASLFSGEAQTIGGESFDLGSLADKDLVLWFWAPW